MRTQRYLAGDSCAGCVAGIKWLAGCGILEISAYSWWAVASWWMAIHRLCSTPSLRFRVQVGAVLVFSQQCSTERATISSKHAGSLRHKKVAMVNVLACRWRPLRYKQSNNCIMALHALLLGCRVLFSHAYLLATH